MNIKLPTSAFNGLPNMTNFSLAGVDWSKTAFNTTSTPTPTPAPTPAPTKTTSNTSSEPTRDQGALDRAAAAQAEAAAARARAEAAREAERLAAERAARIGGYFDSVGSVEAQQIQSMGDMEAAQIGDFDEAVASDILEDPTARDAMMRQAERLEGIATGESGSIADQQFRQNLDRIIKAQSAQAAQTRGAQDSLLAQRETTLAGQDMMAESARESAMLRMEEQRQNEQMLSQVLESVRGLDLTKAIEQAQMETQVSVTNMQANLQKAIENARMEQDAIRTSYMTEFERRQINQQADLQAKLANQNVQLTKAVNQANGNISVVLEKMKSDTQLQVQASQAASARTLAAMQSMTEVYKVDADMRKFLTGAGIDSVESAADRAIRRDLGEGDLDVRMGQLGINRESFEFALQEAERGRPGLLENVLGGLATGAEALKAGREIYNILFPKEK